MGACIKSVLFVLTVCVYYVYSFLHMHLYIHAVCVSRYVCCSLSCDTFADRWYMCGIGVGVGVGVEGGGGVGVRVEGGGGVGVGWE